MNATITTFSEEELELLGLQNQLRAAEKFCEEAKEKFIHKFGVKAWKKSEVKKQCDIILNTINS